MNYFTRFACIAAVSLVTFPFATHATEHRVIIGNFSNNDVSGWKEKVFEKKTIYTLMPGSQGTVIRAKSQGSASAFYRDIRIDLNVTPCLHWSWKVDHALDGLLEKSKAGDDYAARIYVVFSGGIAFWKTRALNYVWSGNQPIGTFWHNAYTNNSINIVMQSGQSKTGLWVHESRNVLVDVQKLIDQNLNVADGVAIMSDTDNSKTSTTADFGDIYFSKSCG